MGSPAWFNGEAMAPRLAARFIAESEEDVWRRGSALDETAWPALGGDTATAQEWTLAQDVRARCANPECKAAPSFWKRSARPVFEGQWACKGCSAAMIEGFVRRHRIITSGAEEPAAHRHRIPLGLLLLHRGLITAEQLRAALEAQRAAGYERIGYWLRTVCGISESVILRGVAVQWNRPVLSSSAMVSATMALTMPESVRREAGLLPLRVAGGKILYAAFEDSIDAAAVAALERTSGLRVECGIVSSHEYARAQERLANEAAVPCSEAGFRGLVNLTEQVRKVLWEAEPVASRMVPVRGGWWLRLWLEAGARGPYGLLPASTEDVRDFVYRSL